MHGKIINQCRLCNKKKLVKVINFGKIPLGNNLLAKKSLSIKAKKYPLILKNCQNCNHFQLNYSVNPNILYAKNYTYLSGTGKSMIVHLKKYANYIAKKINLKKKSFVLDVGSNDGTCLINFKKKGMDVLGIDPAKKPCQIAKSRGINSLNSFFNKKTLKKILISRGKADFVTSHNTLAHVENLRSIFQNIYYVLKKNGYFCFEVGYFYEVLKNNYFDTIYHEHLDYHHSYPLVYFLNNIGFSLINISTNSIQGGTIRILCRKTRIISNTNQVMNFVKKEKKTIIHNTRYLSQWKKAINKKMNKFQSIIKKFNQQNKIVIGYGAPTKAVLLLSISNLNSKNIKYIVEDNHLKQNKYLPISAIPIYNKNMYKVIHPKAIIIFAWNFSDDIIKKLKKDFNTNIEVIIPLPKPIKIQL